jgi:uncharacterized protein (DUF305 family)
LSGTPIDCTAIAGPSFAAQVLGSDGAADGPGEASTRFALISLFAVALGFPVVSCVGLTSAASPAQANPTPTTSGLPSAQEIDRTFISGMVLHHEAAIEMAQVEVERGQRAEVKHLAQQIISTQQSEIKELQQIAQQEFSFTPSTTLPATTEQGVLKGQPILMNFQQDINDLKTSSDPDTMFLQMMIPHHAMAIVQADTQMMQGSNPHLKAMSQKIISTQSHEIGEMEGMLQHH